jgi:hypothetical protein
MNTSKFIGLILLACMVSFGCDLGTGNTNNNNPEIPSNHDTPETITIDNLSVKTTGIKSLYVSNIPVNNSSRAVSNDSVIQTLSYINNVGQNTPFFFISPSGKNIVLNVSNLNQLDEKRILVDFNSFYEITVDENVYTIGDTITNTGRALIDMKTGKVYDFKEYNNIQFASNDLLFTLENQTLYKIDLNNVSVATPLNNSTYTPIDVLDPSIIINNKIIGYYGFYGGIEGDRYSFDINNTFPPKQITNCYLTSGICSFINVNTPITFYNYLARSNNEEQPANGIIIQDLSGSSWYFTLNQYVTTGSSTVGHFGIGVSGNGNQYFIGKISLDDDGEFFVSDYSTSNNNFNIISNEKINMFCFDMSNNGYINILDYTKDYKNNGLTFVFNNGFIKLKKKSNGIQIESTALSMPTVNKNNSFINKDNYLYYIEGSSIKRLYLSSGNSPETVYANSRLLTGGSNQDFLIATGNNLVFYQFADDNMTVNTYSIPMYQQETNPKLLSANSAEIRNIVEFDF